MDGTGTSNMISKHRRKNQRGSFLMEFAFVAPAMLLMSAGAFEIGFSMVRATQSFTLCRNANVLRVGNVDLSQTQNQQLLMRGSTGLSMTLPNSWSPDPNGKGVIIMTKVYLVGPVECAQGINNWDGTAGTCPNYNQYVISNRVVIGNGTRWTSLSGTPGDTPASNGDLTPAQICTNPANIAANFPAFLTLNPDKYTFMSEIFVDISAYNFFSLVPTPVIYKRFVS
jgi:hypothetical protein